MFLQVMNNEEKEKFLELVYKIANIDGEYAQEEEELINNYKLELGLSEISDTGKVEELVEYFAPKNETLKKIVMFEVVGLLNADDKIEKEEEDLLKLMTEKFCFTDDMTKKIQSVAEELQRVYDSIYDLIF